MDTTVLEALANHCPDAAKEITTATALLPLQELLSYVYMNDVDETDADNLLSSVKGPSYFYLKRILPEIWGIVNKRKSLRRTELGIYKCEGMISESLKKNLEDMGIDIVTPSTLFSRIQEANPATIKLLDLGNGNLLSSDLLLLADNLRQLPQGMRDSVRILDLSFNKITELSAESYTSIMNCFPHLEYLVMYGVTPTIKYTNVIYLPESWLVEQYASMEQIEHHIAYYALMKEFRV